RHEFRQRTGDYAASLQALGVIPTDTVVIALPPGLEAIYAFWGALRLGAVPAMFAPLTEKLDPTIYLRNLSDLAERSQVKAVLTNDDFAPSLATQINSPVYALSAFQTQPHLDFTPSTPDPDSIAFLQHSSGTTGLQKGVALSHRAVLNQLASYADSLTLTERDVVVSWLPLYHDMGLIAGFMLPLVQGIPLVLMSPFDWARHPALLLKAIHDYRGTLCWLPNFAYNHCVRGIRERDSALLDLGSMRAFINCSEPVRHDSHTLFAERFAVNGVTSTMLAVSYAMAENTFAVTQTIIGQTTVVDTVDAVTLQAGLRAIPCPPDAPTAAPQVACGAPIAGTQVKVVDADGAVLPERSVGELLIHSDCMLTGYHQRPDLAPFDADGWYHTGDRGYVADGQVYIAGRSKDLIINAGKNLYPQDIEAIVNSVGGVHPGRAVVFGIVDANEGTELVAVVAEVDSADAVTRQQISQQIRQRVGRQTEVALAYVSLVERGWLIKTSSGKIARSQNRDKWLAEREHDRESP
ncbi:MAG: AMP-binding protein, partial [Armatimonadetes bacterium]|nr:AMP-binding protein [Anaerolineae bacterium]